LHNGFVLDQARSRSQKAPKCDHAGAHQIARLLGGFVAGTSTSCT